MPKHHKLANSSVLTFLHLNSNSRPTGAATVSVDSGSSYGINKYLFPNHGHKYLSVCSSVSSVAHFGERLASRVDKSVNQSITSMTRVSQGLF
jgi:hypothetical protein